MNTLSRSVNFALVGLLGFVCQLSLLHLLVGAGMPVSLGTAVAVLAAVAHNFVWHRAWTWRDRAAGSPHAQFLRFVGLNGLVSLAGNVAITAALAAAGVPVLVANAVAVVVCSLANFVLADRLVFAVASVLLVTAGAADAAVLGPRTLAGWQEYVKATEQRIAAEEPNPSAGAPTAGPMATAAWRGVAAVATPDAAFRRRADRRARRRRAPLGRPGISAGCQVEQSACRAPGADLSSLAAG